ncbi:MAG: Patatin [Phycisphaerales bacterium]|nr:Patatin [Phycisphaerales bacterium]
MKKIAIACQGGGSQTAFTAGVLRSFFDEDLHHKVEVVSLSGTSGGAICAALAWYGLLKTAQGDPTPIAQRILGFWEELAAQLPAETAFDDSVATWLRFIDRGVLPHFELSPQSAFVRAMQNFIPSLLPRHEFTDLKALLEKHIEFGELEGLVEPHSPVLLVGAADVLTGEMKKFNSRIGEISIEAILASAAVPTIFPAVKVKNHYYWDGMFSDNPPVQELIRMRSVGGERIPDEIWVIQINPTHCKNVPSTTGEILDRRNELEGNVSLMQNLEVIDLVNLLMRAGALSHDVLAKSGIKKTTPIEVRFINMSEEVAAHLDVVSKLTRNSGHIHELLADGQKQGRQFLEQNLTRPKAARAKRRHPGQISSAISNRRDQAQGRRRSAGPKRTKT